MNRSLTPLHRLPPLPALLKKLPWRLPLKLIPQVLQLAALQQVAGHLLQETLADGELDFLDGPFLRIRVKDLDFDWGVCKRGQTLAFFPGSDGADVTISGDSREFVLLASRREDPDTLFFQRRLLIEGNTELGLQVKNLIDAIDMEQFPRLFNRALAKGADLVEQF